MGKVGQLKAPGVRSGKDRAVFIFSVFRQNHQLSLTLTTLFSRLSHIQTPVPVSKSCTLCSYLGPCLPTSVRITLWLSGVGACMHTDECTHLCATIYHQYIQLIQIYLAKGQETTNVNILEHPRDISTENFWGAHVSFRRAKLPIALLYFESCCLQLWYSRT